MTAIRPTAVAGAFYPADPVELERQLALFLGQARAAVPAEAPVPKAIIAPHAGYVYSGAVAASVYARLAPAKGRVKRVVLIGPSHRVAFRGLAVGTAEAWRTPLGVVLVDRETVDRLALLPMVNEMDSAHAQEHSLEVHVPFLQAVLGAFQLIPIVAGDARAEEVAQVLDAVWGGPETLIVISTDLSHYLNYDSCREIDARTVAAIEHFDISHLDRDCACGRVPVSGLLLAAKRRGMKIETVDVRNSGDTAGSHDKVVGYGSWALTEGEQAGAATGEAAIVSVGPTLIKLARAAIEAGFASGRPPRAELSGQSAILSAPGAVFVTLKKAGQLRGCIGSPTAWRPLVEDVVDNGFKAAFKDPRFPPLGRDELAECTLSVSVLTPPEPMIFTDQADLLAQLRPRIDGLIIEDGGRRALFLPSVWEQLPDKAAFLAHLKAKAGMKPEHWSAGFKASRFQAVEIKD